MIQWAVREVLCQEDDLCEVPWPLPGGGQALEQDVAGTKAAFPLFCCCCSLCSQWLPRQK